MLLLSSTQSANRGAERRGACADMHRSIAASGAGAAGQALACTLGVLRSLIPTRRRSAAAPPSGKARCHDGMAAQPRIADSNASFGLVLSLPRDANTVRTVLRFD